MKIAVDFDGVLHDYKNPVAGRVMGPPLEGARTALGDLKEAGHTIVVFTARGGSPEHVREWMRFWDIPFDYVTNIKETDFDLIVDDRAIQFLNWEDFWTRLNSTPDSAEVSSKSSPEQ